MSKLERFLPLAIKKVDLEVGAYYAGTCRNAAVAQWDGRVFRHWRTKFNSVFVEEIHHPEDEKIFDVFVPVIKLGETDMRPVPPETT